MPDDDEPWRDAPWLWSADRVRAPRPPGGFPRRGEPKAQRRLEHQRELERERRAARLHTAALSRVGALIMGCAVIVVAILVAVLIAAAH